jgi:hypothetical protein
MSLARPLLRQITRLRKRETAARREVSEAGADRARHAENVQTRRDAQLAAASARRGLDDSERS